MTPNKDVVEYYDSEATPGRDLVVALESSIVPPVGTFVNIRGGRYWRQPRD